MVRSAEGATQGGTAVSVVGLSELVRNKEAIFLTELDTVTELKPEETLLVNDDSPRYRRSRLYLEALLRRTPPTEPHLYVGHRAAINVAPTSGTPPSRPSASSARASSRPAASASARPSRSASSSPS